MVSILLHQNRFGKGKGGKLWTNAERVKHGEDKAALVSFLNIYSKADNYERRLIEIVTNILWALWK